MCSQTTTAPSLGLATFLLALAMSVAIDSLGYTDVSAAAKLHRRAFPSFFLSTLGEPFLEEFYRGFLDDSTAVTAVARGKTGALQGVVVGTVQPAGFFGRLLRRRWLGFALASVRAVARRPSVVPRLVGAIRYRGEAGGYSDGALLSSICVDPDVQGEGIGRRLMTEWVSRARSYGAPRAYLTTDSDDNDSVNHFYRALGWSLSAQFVTNEGRRMNRYQITLD